MECGFRFIERTEKRMVELRAATLIDLFSLALKAYYAVTGAEINNIICRSWTHIDYPPSKVDNTMLPNLLIEIDRLREQSNILVAEVQLDEITTFPPQLCLFATHYTTTHDKFGDVKVRSIPKDYSSIGKEDGDWVARLTFILD
jgi:hypothetical protein